MTAVHFVPEADVLLAPRTSLGVGGRARFLARVTSAAELARALDWATARSLPVTVLAGGSNVVVADAGLEALVIDPAVPGLNGSSPDAGRVDLRVGAGVAWDACVAHAVARGWAGLECLSGIPGRAGATPIQNVGAYGQEVGQSLVEVEVFDRDAGEPTVLDREACRLGYRTSRFKHVDRDRFVVLGVRFRLIVDGPAAVIYPDLQARLAGEAAPSLARVREVVLQTRREKSMLIDAADENRRSCGSFFLNPTLDPDALDALAERVGTRPPAYGQDDGRFKLPAAWLIERAGFRRGQRFGNVGISSRHALCLVCHAGASALELASLAHRIRDRVGSLGVDLRPEPRFLGFELDEAGLPRLA